MDRSEQLIAIAALAAPDRAVGAWQEWRARFPIEEATNLLTWAAGYIHRNLLVAGVDDPYLRGIYRHNLISNGARMVAAIGVIRDLSARWEITPLKSFGMTGDRYSRGLRPIADFDFFVADNDVLAVKSHLESLGFTALMNIAEDEFGSRILRQRGSWNFKTSDGVDLDLHWRLLEHLGTAASKKILAANSRVVNSEFGRIRRLDDELMLIGIGVHYQLLGTSLMSGLFDFAHLLRHVDVERAARLARETGSAREIAELCGELLRIVGVGTRPELDHLILALADAVTDAPPRDSTGVVSRMFERIPARYFAPELLRGPVRYRVWFALGRRASLERLLVRTGGPLSRARRESSVGPPAGGGLLGIGWHHLYPEDDYRWANIPDARIVFTGRSDGRRVRITFDRHMWQDGRAFFTIGVFANGHFLGRCHQRAAIFEFDLPIDAVSDTIELSLRLTGDRRFTHPGINEQWYRMMAPVTSIELLPEASASP